ncbi:MAG: hypothetical protein WBG37_08500, partial [Desulfobacterales bacterium]
MPRIVALGCGVLILALLTACQTRHEIKPIEVKTVHEVKPMHITIDVNIKVERALDDFFGEIDQAQQEIYQEKVKPETPETPPNQPP